MRLLIDAQLPPALARVLPSTDTWRSTSTTSVVVTHPTGIFGNTRRAILLAWFEPLIEQIVSMVEQGNQFIELR